MAGVEGGHAGEGGGQGATKGAGGPVPVQGGGERASRSAS